MRKYIGDRAFYSLSGVTGLTIPDGVEEIGDEAFWGLGAESVTVPASVKSLGSGVFKRCESLREAVILAELDSLS